MAKKSSDLKNMRPTLLRTEGGITSSSFNWETSDYWTTFPEVKLIYPFNELYTNDKSAKKAKSSGLMWAIHLMEHPASLIYNLPNKLELIHEQFHEKVGYNIEADPKKYIETYVDVILPEAYRSLTKWYRKLKQRDELLEEVDYTLADIATIDKAITSTKGLWDAFSQIRDQVMMQEGQEIDGATLTQQKLL